MDILLKFEEEMVSKVENFDARCFLYGLNKECREGERDNILRKITSEIAPIQEIWDKRHN